MRDDTSVSLPLTAFAVWYGRSTLIPDGADPREWLIDTMLKELHIDEAEKAAVFVEDSLSVGTTPEVLGLDELNKICEGDVPPDLVVSPVRSEDEVAYFKRMRSIVPDLERPLWLREEPEALFRRLLSSGYKAILIYGPPRTGKSRVIDALIPRTDPTRATIQIHDGWGYDYLVEGLRNVSGVWRWQDGPLKEVIAANKRYIVLEEINRTAFSQAPRGRGAPRGQARQPGRAGATAPRSRRSFVRICAAYGLQHRAAPRRGAPACPVQQTSPGELV